MATYQFKQNFLSPTGFRFLINRLPHVEFFVQAANIPGISMGVTEVVNPFKPTYRHGDKLQFDEFVISVRVDQEMKSYTEIFDWMYGLTSPDNFDSYQNLLDGEGAYSDATLTVLNNKQNPAINVKFKNIFPISLGQISMNTTDGDIDYVMTDITFKTDGWTFETLQRATVDTSQTDETTQESDNTQTPGDDIAPEYDDPDLY